MIAVMISIRPQWCEKIAVRDKSLEVRKTKPNIKTPFKCYIYQTKRNWAYKLLSKLSSFAWAEAVMDGHGKVIGEFVCDSIVTIQYNKIGCGLDDAVINGIIAKSCVPEKELYHYLQGKTPYLWHISNLVIYDKPKPLSKFRRLCQNDLCSESCGMYNNNIETCGNAALMLSRPPQSWCYVEEVKGGDYKENGL